MLKLFIYACMKLVGTSNTDCSLNKLIITDYKVTKMFEIESTKLTVWD